MSNYFILLSTLISYSIINQSRSNTPQSHRPPPRKKRLLKFQDPNILNPPKNIPKFNPDGSENFEWRRYKSSLKLKETWEGIYNRFKDAHLVKQDEIWLGRRRRKGDSPDSDSDEDDDSQEERNGKRKGKAKEKRYRKDEEMRIIRDRGTLRNIEKSIQFGDFIKSEEDEDDLKSEDDSSINKQKSSDEDDLIQDDEDEDELNDWNHDQDSFLLTQYTEFKRDPHDELNFRNTQEGEEGFSEEDEKEEERKSLELAIKSNPDLRDFLMEEKKRRDLLGLASDEEEEESEDESSSEDDDDASSSSQDDEDDDPVIDFADPEWESNAIENRESIGERDEIGQVEQRRREVDENNPLVYDSNSEDELDVLEDSPNPKKEKAKLPEKRGKGTEKSRAKGSSSESESEPASTIPSKAKSNDHNPRHSPQLAIKSKKSQRNDSSKTPSTSQYDYIPSKWEEKRRNIQDLLDSDLLDGSMIPYDIPGLKELLNDKKLRKPSQQVKERKGGNVNLAIMNRRGNDKSKPFDSSSSRASASSSKPHTNQSIPPSLLSRPTSISRQVSANSKDEFSLGKSLKLPTAINTATLPISPTSSHSPNSDRLMRSSSASTSNSTSTSSSTHRQVPSSNSTKAASMKASTSSYQPSKDPTSTPRNVRTISGKNITSSSNRSSLSKNKTTERIKSMISETPPGTPSRPRSNQISSSSSLKKTGSRPSSSQKSDTPTIKRKRMLNFEEEEDDEIDRDEVKGGSTSSFMGSSPCGMAGSHGSGKCSKAFCFTCLSMKELGE